MPRLSLTCAVCLLVPLAAGTALAAAPGAPADVSLASPPAAAGTGGAPAAGGTGAPPAVVTGRRDITAQTPLAAPAGNRATGPRSNGTAVLPSGRYVTPFGRTTTVDLLPTRLLLSRDGRRLYVSSEGMDSAPSPDAYTDRDFNRFITVLDPATLQRTAHVPDDALHYGLAETPDGGRLLASEGATGALGDFAVTPSGLRRTGQTPISGQAYPCGLALAPDGRTAYVGGFSDDTLSVVDVSTRQVRARVATGQYPTDVQLSPDGRRLYVVNTGLYNQDAADNPARPATGGVPLTVPPLTLAGYNGPAQSSVWQYDVSNPAAPTVVARQRIGRDLDGTDVVGGSLPSHVAPSPDGRVVAVSAANNDLVELRDAATLALLRTVDLRPVAGGPTGAQPSALAWSPDGRSLFVAESARDSVAVLDGATGALRGRIPTAWYPTALAVSADGAHLFVASGKGFGAGPNDAGPAHAADKLGTDTSYIVNRLRGVVQDVDLGQAQCLLSDLSAQVARNNGLVAASAADPSGGVVPTAYGSPSKAIEHVVYIVKENRTYDQVFGDLVGTERAQRIAPYSGKVTPNHHAIARQFGISDNHYVVAQTSYDGHYAVDTGQANRFATLMAPLSYANKLPHDRFVTSPENLPQGGFLWNNLARHGVSFKIYGEATYLVGLSPTLLNAGGSPTDPLPPALYGLGGPASGGSFSLTYPSQVTQETPVSKGSDTDRATDFLRDLGRFNATGQMPSLLQLSLPDDHTDGARPGSPTPQTYVGVNDEALGRIVDGLSKSPFWGKTAVFVVEDDAQDGQDHVDASRSFVLAAGGLVRPGYVSRVHSSTLSVVKTLNLLLGVPPTSVDEMTSTSLADFFMPQLRTDTYDARPNQVGSATNPPYPSASNTSLAAQAARLMDRVPPGVDRGGPALQDSLRLQAQAAAAAGSAQVPPQPDVVQTFLDRSSPAPAPQSCPRPPGTGTAPGTGPGAGAEAAGVSSAAPSRVLAATGPVAVALPAAGIALVLGIGVLRRRRA